MRNVLIIRPGAMGDVCLTIPVVRALQAHCRLTWLIFEHYAPLARCFDDLQAQLLPMNPRAGSSLLPRLRQANLDAILDLCHWPETARLVAELGDVPVRATVHDPAQDRRLGINPAGCDLYAPFNRLVPVNTADHQVDKWKKLIAETLAVELELEQPPRHDPNDRARFCCIEPPKGATDRSPGCSVAEPRVASVQSSQPPKGVTQLICHPLRGFENIRDSLPPGSAFGCTRGYDPSPPSGVELPPCCESAHDQRISAPLRVFVQPHSGKASKIWPVPSFIEVLTGLHARRPIEVLINSGNRQEWLRAARLWAGLRWRGVPAALLIKDRRYRRLVGALRTVHLGLGNDSGPMHLAALLGVPTVVVYGPYSPREFCPLWHSSAVAPPEGAAADKVSTSAVAEALDEVLWKHDQSLPRQHPPHPDRQAQLAR